MKRIPGPRCWVCAGFRVEWGDRARCASCNQVLGQPSRPESNPKPEHVVLTRAPREDFAR